MGLYSKNRISALYEADDEVKDPMGTEGETEECGSSCKEMTDLLEFSISIVESEGKMFDALIETDFIAAQNQFALKEADDEETKEEIKKADNSNKGLTFEKIKKFIIDTIEKAIAAIKGLAQSIIAKLIDVFNADEKLNKWSDSINHANYSNFKGIGNFVLPDAKGFDIKTSYEEFVINNGLTSLSEKLTVDATQEEIDNTVKEIDTKITEIEKSTQDWKNDVFKAERVNQWKPNSADITNIANYGKSNKKEYIDGIKKVFESAYNSLKDMRDNVKKQKSKDEAANAKINSIRLCITKVINFEHKQLNEYIGIFKKTLAAYRKAYILCGRYAVKSSNKSTVATGESVMDALDIFMLSEACDMYEDIALAL